MKTIQDLYPADFAHCYGCGRLNQQGLHIRTEWTCDQGVARFRPRAEHVALPGFVYGGLLASLIDCHSIGTAAAAFMLAGGSKPGVDPSPRFVTASLEVQFLKPTPMDAELVITARPVEVGQRKVIVESTLSANGVDCVRGRVVAVQVPADMIKAREAGH